MRCNHLLGWIALGCVAGQGVACTAPRADDPYATPDTLPPTAQTASRPRVVAVYPSGDTLPEKVLRLSVELAEPVNGQLLDAMALRFDDGTAAEGAFLQQELWSPDRRTLTVLLHPGRVKSGLVAHDTLGPPLRANTGVSLLVGGAPVHRWQVAEGGCAVPEPSTWTVSAPPGGSSEPLVVTLGGAIDAQSRGLIIAVDADAHVVEGAAALSEGERVWRLAPKSAWRPGAYRLMVHPRIESPCGDELGEPFEHASGRGLGAERRAVAIPFQIR